MDRTPPPRYFTNYFHSDFVRSLGPKIDGCKRRNGQNFFAIPLRPSFSEYPIKLDEGGQVLWSHTRFLAKGESVKPLSIEGLTWERTINEECPDSTLVVFFFTRKLLETAPADSLVKNQISSKKYSYKVKDLESIGWRIECKE